MPRPAALIKRWLRVRLFLCMADAFTAKDVQCTFHRLNGKEADYLRRNPRKIWYETLTEVTTSGDYEARSSGRSSACWWRTWRGR